MSFLPEFNRAIAKLDRDKLIQLVIPYEHADVIGPIHKALEQILQLKKQSDFNKGLDILQILFIAVTENILGSPLGRAEAWESDRSYQQACEDWKRNRDLLLNGIYKTLSSALDNPKFPRERVREVMAKFTLEMFLFNVDARDLNAHRGHRVHFMQLGQKLPTEIPIYVQFVLDLLKHLRNNEIQQAENITFMAVTMKELAAEKFSLRIDRLTQQYLEGAMPEYVAAIAAGKLTPEQISVVDKCLPGFTDLIIKKRHSYDVTAPYRNQHVFGPDAEGGSASSHPEAKSSAQTQPRST